MSHRAGSVFRRLAPVLFANCIPSPYVLSPYHRFLGGVNGRPLPMPPYAYFFLSAGFRMRKEHIKLSSTAITAPALSNSPQ